MGLLDIPAPAFGAVEDAIAGFFPPIVRLLFWAAVAAAASIELYRLLSPQKRISAAMQDLQVGQRELAGFDGEFKDALPLMGRTLGAAGRRLLLVFPAAIAASLPALALIVWLDTTYGARLPDPGEPVAVKAEPARYDARWLTRQDAAGQNPAAGEVLVTDPADSRPVASATIEKPVSTIHKWQWWNVLIGNPAGYLPQESPVERIDVQLPRSEVIAVGPDWARGWEVPFFLAFLGFALFAKWARQVV